MTSTPTPTLYQSVIRLTRPVRDARAVHRAIEHDAHPVRALWAQPSPRTLVVRTSADTRWAGFPFAAAVSTSLTRTRYDQDQDVDWALVANPTRSSARPTGGRGRRTGIADPGQAAQWARDHLAPALDVAALAGKRLPSAHGQDGLCLTRWAFSGTAAVNAPDALARLLAEGVGRGKAFGCGLLLISTDRTAAA